MFAYLFELNFQNYARFIVFTTYTRWKQIKNDVNSSTDPTELYTNVDGITRRSLKIFWLWWTTEESDQLFVTKSWRNFFGERIMRVSSSHWLPTPLKFHSVGETAAQLVRVRKNKPKHTTQELFIHMKTIVQPHTKPRVLCTLLVPLFFFFGLGLFFSVSFSFRMLSLDFVTFRTPIMLNKKKETNFSARFNRYKCSSLFDINAYECGMKVSMCDEFRCLYVAGVLLWCLL